MDNNAIYNSAAYFNYLSYTKKEVVGSTEKKEKVHSEVKRLCKLKD